MSRKCDFVCVYVVHESLFSHVPHRDTARRHRELCFTPLQLLRRGQTQGREIALAYYDGTNVTHTHTHNYIPTRIYTQRLSVKPIPPNGRSLILLTGAQGGNEVCHLYIHDPWLTSLPHSPPPSWPGNGTLLGWEGETEIGYVIPFEWSALTQTSACWVHKSPRKWGQSQCLAICFDSSPPPPPSLTLSLSPLPWEIITVSNHAGQYGNDASVEEWETEESDHATPDSVVHSYYLFDAYATRTG